MFSWRNTELTDEQERQIKQLREELQLDYEDDILEVRREYKDKLAGKDDAIAELKRQLDVFKKRENKVMELVEQERELDLRDGELDDREKLLDLRETHLAARLAEHNRDYEHHHKIALQYQEDAKDMKNAARAELTSAESKAYDYGHARGYADGFADGIGRTSLLGKEALAELSETAKLVVLSSAQSRPVTFNDKGEPIQTPGERALADAFAKHLTGLVDQVMTRKKETK